MFGTEEGAFAGQLQGESDHFPMPVVVQVDDGRLRMWSGRKRLGSWPLPEVTAERVSPFRFRLVIENQRFSFNPEDPTGFSEAVGVVVDLRTGTRFGLAARLRQGQSGGEQGT